MKLFKKYVDELIKTYNENKGYELNDTININYFEKESEYRDKIKYLIEYYNNISLTKNQFLQLIQK